MEMVLVESMQMYFIFRAFNEPFNTIPKIIKASLVAQMVKNSPAIQETRVRSLGWEDPLDKGMAIHCSIVTWRIPWIGKSDRLQSIWPQRVGHK